MAARFSGFNFAMGAQGLEPAQGMQKHPTLCKGKIHKITLFLLTSKSYRTVHQGRLKPGEKELTVKGVGHCGAAPSSLLLFFFFNVDECLSMVLWLKATL